MLKEYGLYLHTARHYHFAQIAARLKLTMKARMRSRFPGLATKRYAHPGVIELNPGFRCFEAERPNPLTLTHLALENAAAIDRGTFRFLNSARQLGSPVDWNPAGTTRLWRYNLHYFDYALDMALSAAQSPQNSWAAERLRRVFSEWIAGNPIGRGVGWHSYPIARRIVNWIQAYSLAGPEVLLRTSSEAEPWRLNLFQQASYLEDHLEYDCMGNHLLTNGKALLFAGLFFSGDRAARWVRRGEEILWDALRDQIHADGGHEERSPMYQTIVLQDYVEVVSALRLNGRPVPDEAIPSLISMGDFLEGTLHPDGRIALFGDAAFSIAHEPGDVLAALARWVEEPCRWRSAAAGPYCQLIAPLSRDGGSVRQPGEARRTSWPDTGYFKLTGARSDDQMIIDALPMGPEHLPAHGHCSLFSYELSLRGKRVIVDSGVEEYEAGPWRNFWRSTRAHNTLSVDGAEQTEIWASFRAARRTAVRECSFVQNEFGSLFVGRHRGFATQTSPTPHRRVVAALREGIWLVFDQVFGEGTHRIDNYIHFHPELSCRVMERKVGLDCGGFSVSVHPLLSGRAAAVSISTVRGSTEPIQGWYAPEFGRKIPDQVLCLSSQAGLPAQAGYLIAPSELDLYSWSVQLEEAQGKASAATILIDLGSEKIVRDFRIH